MNNKRCPSHCCHSGNNKNFRKLVPGMRDGYIFLYHRITEGLSLPGWLIRDSLSLKSFAKVDLLERL